MDTSQKQDLILRESDSDRQVVLVPADQDMFVMSCRDAVRAAEIGLSGQVVAEEIGELLNHARSRIEGFGMASAAYAVIRDGQIVVFVVPQGDTMDFDLNAQLVALDLELAEKFQAVSCDVIQIPRCSVGNFVDQHGLALLPGHDPG